MNQWVGIGRCQLKLHVRIWVGGKKCAKVVFKETDLFPINSGINYLKLLKKKQSQDIVQTLRKLLMIINGELLRRDEEK